MFDIEKVLKGLEAHATASGCIKNCPYWAIEKLDCSQELAADALSLLKAQQPRVLTIEEVAGRIALEQIKPIYLEYGPMSRYEGKIIEIIPHNVYFTEMCTFEWIDENNLTDGVFIDEMNTVWRCWNVRPTDEQRKAAKWDD